MLGTDALVNLVRESHDMLTLSVYIDGRVTDPAMRTSWRIEVQNALDAARTGVPPVEREAFLVCATRMEQALSRFDGAIGSPGFVAFVTPDQVRFAESVSTPMPTIAFWSRGARVAPYVRALEHERPVIAVVSGSREARLYKWNAGTLSRLETLIVGDQGQVASPSRSRGNGDAAGHHNGRGSSASDDLQRVHDAQLHRLISDTVDCVVQHAGNGGWVVLGGAKDVVPRVMEALPRTVAQRTLVHPGMSSKATIADLRDGVVEGATRLRHAREQRLVSELVERAHATKNARATVGLERTRSAIELGAVEELLLTRTAWATHPAEVERVVSGTLMQGGLVEQVDGDAARTLDAEGGGIGALLRFPTP